MWLSTLTICADMDIPLQVTWRKAWFLFRDGALKAGYLNEFSGSKPWMLKKLDGESFTAGYLLFFPQKFD